MGSPREREPASGRLPRRPGDLSAMTTPADRLARLAMDARYDLERRDLYRGKANGPDAVSAERLHDLERAYELSAGRLAAAEAELPAHEHLWLRSVRVAARAPRTARDELPVTDYDMYSPDFVESSLRGLIDGHRPKER